jgi:predicted O-methyltransferase YrrM
VAEQLTAVDFHQTSVSPQTPLAVVELLSALINTGDYIVESGTFDGYTARQLAYGLPRRIDTLDPCGRCWTERPRFGSNIIYAHQCRAMDFIPAEPIDLCFIDSDPSERIAELYHFLPYMRAGGVIVIDDAKHYDLDPTGLRWVRLPIANGLILATA